MSILIPKVGMRTVKTAVSVMISYLVFVPFGLLYREELGGVWGQMGPLYACIACVVCMQSSLGQTMQQGISRFIGVAVGGTLGVLVLALGEPVRYPLVKALMLGVVCVAGVWLCLLLKRPGRLCHGLYRTLRDSGQRDDRGGTVLLCGGPHHRDRGWGGNCLRHQCRPPGPPGRAL